MVSVRAATPADAEAISRIRVATWKAAYAGLIDDATLAALEPEPEIEPRRARLANLPARTSVFVAEDAGEVVGFAQVGLYRDEDLAASADGELGELFALYVRNDYWGSGVGHALHEAGVVALKEAGFTRARLWVLAGNTQAIAFYERHGWVAEDVHKLDERFGPVVTEDRYALNLLRAGTA